MRTLSLKAYVLKSQKVGASDRLLTLLTAEHGLLTAFANGAARPQSKLVAVSLPYTLAQFQLRAGRDSYTVQSGDLVYAFAPLREDFARLAEADRLAKLFADAVRHDLGQTSVYELFGHALYALCRTSDPAFCGAVASVRLLNEIGYAPWLGDCVVCHHELERPYVFDLEESGLCCPRHAGSFSAGLDPAVVAILRHIAAAELGRLFGIGVPADAAKAFVALADRYVELKMERRYERFALPDLGSWPAPRKDGSLAPDLGGAGADSEKQPDEVRKPAADGEDTAGT